LNQLDTKRLRVFLNKNINKLKEMEDFILSGKTTLTKSEFDRLYPN